MRFYLFSSLVFLLFSCEPLPEDNGGGIKPTPNPTPTPQEKPTFKAGRFSKELPTQKLGNLLIQHDFYAASYVTRQKNAEWVAYEIQAELMEEGDDVDRSSSFSLDSDNPLSARSSDYTNSGYDRGHLASAEDMSFDEKAMASSFLMTNISPQEPKFNRGIWKSLEGKVRKWASKDRRLYVVTGPILPKRITSTVNRIGDSLIVPNYFYKVVLDYDLPERKGIAFIFENKESTAELKRFAVSIDEVESRTGIDFFPTLSTSEQAALEAKFDLNLWDFE